MPTDDLLFVLLEAACILLLLVFAGPGVAYAYRVCVDRARAHFMALLVPHRPETVVRIMFGVIVLAVALLGAGLGLWGTALGVACGIPALLELLVFRAKTKRREQLDLQLPDTLVAIASSMRSGMTLVQALEVTQETSIPPMSKEIGLVLAEYRLAVSIDEALRKVADRVKSRYLSTAVSAIAITQRTGGRLPDRLTSIAESIREIMRIENQINAMTAQGRMEALVMGLMPFVAIVGFYMFDKEMVVPLFTDSIGHMLLAIIVFCNIIGVLVIRKIMAIDV